MLWEVVQKMHLDTVEILLVNMILCNIWLYVHFIFINATMLCTRKQIVPSETTPSFLQLLLNQQLFQAFWDFVCKSIDVESTENILVTKKLIQKHVHVLNRELIMALVLCYKVKMHYVLDAQNRIWEENPFAYRRFQQSCHEHWKIDQP